MVNRLGVHCFPPRCFCWFCWELSPIPSTKKRATTILLAKADWSRRLSFLIMTLDAPRSPAGHALWRSVQFHGGRSQQQRRSASILRHCTLFLADFDLPIPNALWAAHIWGEWTVNSTARELLVQLIAYACICAPASQVTCFVFLLLNASLSPVTWFVIWSLYSVFVSFLCNLGVQTWGRWVEDVCCRKRCSAWLSGGI